MSWLSWLSWLPWAVVAWLFVIGLYGIATSRNLFHAIVSLSVMQSATYILLLAIGFRRGGTAPVFDTFDPGTRQVVDPVVQALTFTDVVVAAAVTALLLAIAVQVKKTMGTVRPDEMARLEE
jgi:multicomponent Na+:H+ antiporter subunit C